MGPTASGKTALACALCDRFADSVGFDLISVDSALVYRGMAIGTAKPDAFTLARHPHALIDIRDPAEPYSAADFRDDATAAMARSTAQGRVPLLVGGTGLYFRALQQGLSSLPPASSAIRAKLASEAARLGWASMHARLRQFDPSAAARIGPNDAQRLQRALEVIELTGRPLSELQRGRTSRFPWRVLKLALLPPDRSVLHERIARRFDAMLAANFLDEVRQLRAREDVLADIPSMRAVGYRQAWEHLDGLTDMASFRDKGIFATRQLAKRQLTWLRNELDARALNADHRRLHECAADALQRFLAGPIKRN